MSGQKMKNKLRKLKKYIPLFLVISLIILYTIIVNILVPLN